MTEELLTLRKQYKKKFGYDPNADIEIELGDKDYDRYVNALEQSLQTGKDMFQTLEVDY